MADKKEKTDLEKLTGNDFEEIEIKGNKLRIEPIKLKNMTAFSKASRNIFGFFAGGNPDFIKIAENMESVADVILAGSPLSAEEVAELNAAEVTNILSVIIAVNADFFVSSVLPAFQGGLKTLTDAMAGRTQFNS